MNITKILKKYKYKVSNKSREFILKNVYLYPAFFMIFQLPIFLQTHNVFLFIYIFFNTLSLMSAAICHKKRLIGQIEPVSMFCISTVIVVLGYFFFFLGLFNFFIYSFLLYCCISILSIIYFFTTMTGRQKENNQHDIMDHGVNSSTSSELNLLRYLMGIDYILIKYLFTIDKTMHISYIPKLDIYLRVKQAVLNNKFQTYYVFSEDIEFTDEHLVSELSGYIKEFDIDINILTSQHIKLFIINKY